MGSTRHSNRKRKKSPEEISWRNEDGSFKTDREILLASKKWKRKTWNRFLNENMGKGNPIDYKLVYYKYLDPNIPCPKKESEENYSNKFKTGILKLIFRLALEELTQLEYSVIRRIFWEDQRPCKIAKILNSTSKTVTNAKNRALKKLKRILTSGAFLRRLGLEELREKQRNNFCTQGRHCGIVLNAGNVNNNKSKGGRRCKVCI